ncbi:hypothetical protein AB838_20820 [Rhodobacteraceae bacterium (ex Bugula neritina AB1)]|nr:hypothetical protein AB838_20820 [Rhodobacteraceae bacterium (ex Bugula neritina AB1)]
MIAKTTVPSCYGLAATLAPCSHAGKQNRAADLALWGGGGNGTKFVLDDAGHVPHAFLWFST